MDNPALTTRRQLAAGMYIFAMLVYRDTVTNVLNRSFTAGPDSKIQLFTLNGPVHRRNIELTSYVTLKAIATHLQPLWWNPLGRGSDTYGFLVEVHDYSTQKLLHSSFEISYGTNRLVRKFVRGRAIKITSDPTTVELMAIHLARIDVGVAAPVVIEFRLNINDSLMVISNHRR